MTLTKQKPNVYICAGCGKELTENEKGWHICQGREDTRKMSTLQEILTALKELTC